MAPFLLVSNAVLSGVLKRFVFVNVATLSIIVVVFTTEVRAEPSEENVREYLTGLLGPGLEVTNIRIKVFPLSSAGQGRVSAAGDIQSLESRYDFGDPTMVLRELVETLKTGGMSEDQIQRYGRAAGIFNTGGLSGYRIVRPIVLQGASFPFTAELNYLETVDGFNFSGGVNHEICCRTLHELGANEIPLDSDRYQALLASMMGWLDYENSTLPKIIEQHFGGIANGGTVWEGDKPVAKFSSFDLSSLDWKVLGQNSNNGAFRETYISTAPTKLETIDDSTFKIGWREVASGGPENIEIQFRMDLFNPTPSDSCIAIKTSDWKSGSSCLQDGVFSKPFGQYGGIADGSGEHRYVVKPSEVASEHIPSMGTQDNLRKIVVDQTELAQNSEDPVGHFVEATYAARRLLEDFPEGSYSKALLDQGMSSSKLPPLTKERLEFEMIKACSLEPNLLCLVDWYYIVGDRASQESVEQSAWFIRENPENVSPNFLLLFRADAAVWYAVQGHADRVLSTYQYHLSKDIEVGVQNLAQNAPAYAFALALIGLSEEAELVAENALERALAVSENEMYVAKATMVALPAWLEVARMMRGEGNADDLIRTGIDPEILLRVLNQAFRWSDDPLLTNAAEVVFEECLNLGGFKAPNCATEMAAIYAHSSRLDDAISATKRPAKRDGNLWNAIQLLISMNRGTQAAMLYEKIDPPVRSPLVLADIGSAGAPEYLEEATQLASQMADVVERDQAFEKIAQAFARTGDLKRAQTIANEMSSSDKTNEVINSFGSQRSKGLIQQGDQLGFILLPGLPPEIARDVIYQALPRMQRN